ncbi:DUF6115 domain-containing protein [Neobacillus ginsengisoli]|uniref:DUF2802 domain-containing protein n=1 Tax=Neobacillus ginsengisoli TaxID=904295 RepID=A0ABT9XWD5_9BACI|nr:hypothetical protein [Neobacillus ginsengisoli]MDQ0199575.1 hypothetical protein [Neobacillus ginsengisoli]
MLNYLNATLLGLNLLGVVILVVRGTFERKNSFGQELQLKIIDDQKKLSREMTVLKRTIEDYQTIFLQESERQRAERQVFEASVQTVTNSKREQELFLNDRYKEIFDLQKKGLSAEQIAKKLEKGCGEISFILQLAAKARN